MLCSSNHKQCLTPLFLIPEKNLDICYALLSCHVFPFHFISFFVCVCLLLNGAVSLKWVVHASLVLILSFQLDQQI